MKPPALGLEYLQRQPYKYRFPSPKPFLFSRLVSFSFAFVFILLPWFASSQYIQGVYRLVIYVEIFKLIGIIRTI